MGKKDRYDFEGADDSLDGDASRPSLDADVDDTSGSDTAAVEEIQNSSPQSATTTGAESTGDEGSNQDEIPHRVRYDSPKDGRKAKTFYLDQDRDLARLRELHSLAETEFSQKVHRLDVYLAAFRSDLSDESFLKEMRRIGYGYFD